jgi:hypothetical protein
LNYGDDVFFEIGADIAEPLGEIGRGWAKAGGTLSAATDFGTFTGGFIVDGGECFIHAGLFTGELAATGPSHFREGFLGVLAEDEAPAF